MRVFLHTRSSGQRDWTNTEVDFAQIPAVGEYVATRMGNPDWYVVELVVHTPFPCDFDAEVYAVAWNHLEVLEGALNG